MYSHYNKEKETLMSVNPKYYLRVRGDGNCFYTAFIYNFLNIKLLNGN